MTRPLPVEEDRVPDHIPDLGPAIARMRELHAAGMGGILRTPLIPAPSLPAPEGAQIWVKLETLQQTGSFKERGAYTKLKTLCPAERARGVVAASAGNHAQGVALHAHRLGITATIFMPTDTPAVKVQQTRAHGAHVRLEGADYDACSALAQAYCRETGCVFVHPFDDLDVMAGQGSIALEMLQDNPELDVLVVPAGGGGMLAGIATVARQIKPDIEIVGVQADRFPALHSAFHGRPPSCEGISLAEGIAVRQPGALTARLIRDRVDDMLLVSEHDIERALNLYLTRLRVLAEGAGAAGLAALGAHPERFVGKTIGLVLCGGNIDTRLLSSVLLRDLARSRRLARFRIELLDIPGQLSAVSDVISEAGGNVTDVAYHKTFSDLPAKVTYIDISLEAHDAAHMDRIEAALRSSGFKVSIADY